MQIPFTEMMAMGQELWQQTHKMTDEEAYNCIYNLIKDKPRSPKEIERGSGGEELIAFRANILQFAAKWAGSAYQRLQTSHTFAAAMMATHTPLDCYQEISLPWPAFIIEVPSGILSYRDGDGGVGRILCAQYDKQAEIIMCMEDSTYAIFSSVETGETLIQLLDDNAEVEPPKPNTWGEQETDTYRDKAVRAIKLAKRLVAGLLFSMQSVENFREKIVPAKRYLAKGRTIKEPEHRIAIIGHPVKVDCREAIRSYIDTGRYEREDKTVKGLPKYQVLVRPHRKRQVCGMGRLERKIIWVEAYWRGNEGAPIMTSPKVIKDA